MMPYFEFMFGEFVISVRHILFFSATYSIFSHTLFNLILHLLKQIFIAFFSIMKENDGHINNYKELRVGSVFGK